MSFRKFGIYPSPSLSCAQSLLGYVKQVSPNPENQFLHLKADLLFNPKWSGRKKKQTK